MSYLSDSFWQDGEAKRALLLQLVRHRKSGEEIVLGSIFHGDETNENYNRMLRWFYEDGLKALARYRNPQSSLRKLLRTMERNGLSDCAGFYVRGESFLLWQKGPFGIWLLNRAGKGDHVKKWSHGSEKELNLFTGVFSSGTEIVLGNDAFEQAIRGKELEECLGVCGIQKFGLLSGRMRELGNQLVQQGGRNMEAITVYYKEDKKRDTNG